MVQMVYKAQKGAFYTLNLKYYMTKKFLEVSGSFWKFLEVSDSIEQ